MNQEKYIGMDVHQATISVAVSEGKFVSFPLRFSCSSSHGAARFSL
jgi:hypothetical protein